MLALRQEIIEAQKVRSDLMKWKLVLVAAIGAAAFGFSTDDSGVFDPLALCAIPFVCVYVDTLCRHLSLRIQSIGTFIRKMEGDDLTPELTFYKRYEEYSFNFAWRKGFYRLESLALVGSSVFLNLFIAAYGLSQWMAVQVFAWSDNNAWIFFAGLLGVLGAVAVEYAYNIIRKKPTAASDEEDSDDKGAPAGA